MERYHIFKLGWAIVFYATYYGSTMLVSCLDGDNELDYRNAPNPDHEYFRYFQGVDGIPGRDFPVHSFIPRTSFNCRGIESGYYADLETDCQVFHICEEGKKISFLCPNGTIFQQSELICEWWNKVNCTNSPNLYEESAERLHHQIARRKASRRVNYLNGAETKHGAVMRVEERTSIRATKGGKEYDVPRATQRTRRIKNHRIPDNYDIEQQIEEAESNNRHLANAQNGASVSQENDFIDQNERHPNHNYNDVNQNAYNTVNSNTNSSTTKQTKKDVDSDTGNFINGNYDSDSARNSKKVVFGEKNNFSFDTKGVEQKGSSLKEYHIEFGSTNIDVDYSTKSYSLPKSTNLSSGNQNSKQEGQKVNGQEKYDREVNEEDYEPSPSYSTEQYESRNNFQANDNYNKKTESLNHDSSYKNNVFSSTALAPQEQRSFDDSISKNLSFSEESFKSSERNRRKNNRGNVKFNSNSNNQKTNQQENLKSQIKSVPITTYSPPVNYGKFKLLQESKAHLKENQKTVIQDEYDLPFPKHKSELIDDYNSNGSTSEQTDISVSSTAAPLNLPPNQNILPPNENILPPNHKSFDVASETKENRSQDSDETQEVQESSSFVKSSFNSITDNSFKTSSSPYSNHKSTYSDIQDISYLELPKLQSISSVTAHLVTTQPINNGRPFFALRTTRFPNEPTTQSKYTYLPTTSAKPTIIFGVIRHNSTTELPPYGPPELFNLGNIDGTTQSDLFNIDSTDKTLSTVETTTTTISSLSTELFNTGNTESTTKETTTDSRFVTSTEGENLTIGLKDANGYQKPENLNVNQKNFNFGVTGYTSILDRFNIGSTDSTRPTVEPTTPATNSVPTEIYNSGFTDSTLTPTVVPSFDSRTVKPLNLHVPEPGKLHVGLEEAQKPLKGDKENFKFGETSYTSILDSFNSRNTDKTHSTVKPSTFVVNPVSKRTSDVDYTGSTVPNVIQRFETSTLDPLDVYVSDHGSASANPTGTYNYQELGFTGYTSIAERFNTGNTNKIHPTTETTTLVTNYLPTDLNVGFTGSTIDTNVVPSYATSTFKPLDIYVPEQGNLNIEDGKANIRHNNQELGSQTTTQEPFNLGSTGYTSISDGLNIGSTDKTVTGYISIANGFNVGNTDKTLPTTETSIPSTNSIPTETFNVGFTGSTIKPNVASTFATSTIKPLEVNVPEHGSLNLAPGDSNISHGLESQNQAHFRFGDTSYAPIADRFNVGNTDKTRPSIETTIPVTNPLPTEPFNVGNTGNTIKPITVPSLGSSTVKPLEIYVPDHGSLNVGKTNMEDNYKGLESVNEPPFIKKTVSLLYQNVPVSTERTVDHATVYGTLISTTQRPLTSSSNTPYSPTVPTVTQSYSRTFSSSPQTPKVFTQGIPIRFEKGQDKITVQLSKNLGGQSQTKESPIYGTAVQPPRLKVNAVLQVGDDQSFGIRSNTAAPFTKPNGFLVTKDYKEEVSDGFSKAPKSKFEKPRPFTKPFGVDERLNSGNTNSGLNTIGSTFPAYQISSARPFAVRETTTTAPFTTTQETTSFNVYDNIDSMMNVLKEIVKYNSQKKYSEEFRPGLVIPPSVGPQTLHSLAQYFANDLQNNDSENEVLKPETKEELTGLLTAMTFHGYNNLFKTGSTAKPVAATNSIDDDSKNNGTKVRFGSEEVVEENSTVRKETGNTEKDVSTESDDNLLTTTSLPELRQLARNFSLALSSYLHDPDNFKKSLEGLRPTEPPPLDNNDNVESSTIEDELLNFSDADVKPSTPALSSPTWGYIVASELKKDTEDEVKNSLNPDLNTADSQSFIPRFNNLQVDENKLKSFTDLPPGHWTSSPQATKLWQKALSVNPAVVNQHFETTIPSIIISAEEGTTESQLYNEDVEPDLSEHSEISYDLRELPPLTLNSTQVHGLLIDFMNHTKTDEHNRLNRILKKLNTSEGEFLDRMKEIESNPLTKRLILLLISECGANITEDLRAAAASHHKGTFREETSSSVVESSTLKNVEKGNRENHSLRQLVHPGLKEGDQDARALQLLNSLYTIASRFGRKR